LPLLVGLFFSWYLFFLRRLAARRVKKLAQLQVITGHVQGMVYEFEQRPDGSEGFTFVSEGVRAILRIGPKELIRDVGKFYANVHPDDLAAMRAAGRQSARTLTPWIHQYRLCFAGEAERWLSAQSSPRRRADGSTLWNGLVTDVTEHKRIEAMATASSQAKSLFLANMSHEIRTPMNGVVGMIDVLQQTQLDAKQTRMVETVHKSALALLTILDDILDYSKIEAGKLIVEQIPMHLRDLVEGVAQLMVVAAKSKAVELSLFVAPELPSWIMSDPNRLRQVLFNLLGNAVKFTDPCAGRPATVMLSVEPCTLAAGGAGLQLQVIDNGIGMNDQTMAKLFEPFSQADESTARKFGGTGLGLGISRHLVELLGGRISIDSSIGEGSAFTVELPLQACLPTNVLALEPVLPGLPVLVVVRDATLQRIVTAYCHKAQTVVTLLADQAAAQQYLQQLPSEAEPPVLLLAFETEAQPAPTWPAGTRVVRLASPVERPAEGIELTVQCHPLIYGDLIKALSLASQTVTLPSPLPVLAVLGLAAPESPAPEQIFPEGKLILFAEDNPINREVIEEQLRLLGYACEMAVDGLEALAMWRTGRYAMLLTDCQMPQMDGFELTRAIRQAEPAGTRLPIVAITANAMQGVAERCLAHGMDDFMSKPLRMVTLAPMLEKWLSKAVTNGQGYRGPVDGAGQVQRVAMPGWDASRLEELVGENPLLHRRWLEKFAINAEKQVAAVAQALAAEEFRRVADEVHSLKSAARMVGAVAFGELCEEIETAGTAGDETLTIALCQRLSPALDLVKDHIARHLEAATC